MKIKKNYLIISFLIIIIVGLLFGIMLLKKRQSDKMVVLIVNNTPISQVCYDYYFYSYYNSYIKNYSFLMDYMEVDPDKDIMDQQYDEDRTFREYFNDCTVDQIVKIMALCDDGQKNGFEYDAEAEFESYLNTVEESLKGSKNTVYKYFSSYFGPYANKKNIHKYMVDGYYAMGYYNMLLEKELEKYDSDMDKVQKNALALDVVSEYVNGLKENYEVIYW